MAQQQRIPERVLCTLRRLGTAGEEFHAQLSDLRRSRISVQVAVVQGGKSVDILGDEIGDVQARVNEERITQDDLAGAGGAVDSRSLVARHDVGLDVAKSAGSGNGVELRTDLDLPKRLDRVAVDSLETASIGREQGREKVTIVAQELDNRVRDSDIIRTRIDAAREVVAMNVGQDYGARRWCRRDCRDRWTPCRGGVLVQES